MNAKMALAVLVGAARDPYGVEEAVAVLRKVLEAAQLVVDDPTHAGYCSALGDGECDCTFGEELGALTEALG